jgi:GAF domain-containing protein
MDDTRHNNSIPPSQADLTRERESFVRNFLRKGVEFTEELIRENEDLRRHVQLLERDNTELRAQVKSDDAMRDVLRTIERLEQEKKNLLDRSSQLEQATRRYEGRYAAIEQELNDLANLYVASFQLHSTLKPPHVLQHIRELLAQLVGAECFVIYVIADDGKRAIPVGSEGVLENDLKPVYIGEGAIGSVCASGQSSVKQGNPLGRGSLDAPLAVIPMLVDGQTVGVIAIVRLLEQKEAWVQVDQELFHLLGTHAAAALLAAHMYQRETDLLSAIAGLGESLK